MNYRPILVITKTILLLLCINTTQAQSDNINTNYAFLQGGFFSGAGNSGLSGLGALSLGYLTKDKNNVLEGVELNIKSAFNRNTIRSIPTFLDTIPTLVGGNVDYFEVEINYVRTKEYINTDKLSFGLMSGVGTSYGREETDPRVNGGMSFEKAYDIHIYTGPYLNINLADRLSLLVDWSVFEFSVGMSTSDFIDDNGELFEQGPFLDLELNGLFNHVHIGVMYAL